MYGYVRKLITRSRDVGRLGILLGRLGILDRGILGRVLGICAMGLGGGFSCLLRDYEFVIKRRVLVKYNLKFASYHPSLSLLSFKIPLLPVPPISPSRSPSPISLNSPSSAQTKPTTLLHLPSLLIPLFSRFRLRCVLITFVMLSWIVYF